MPAQRGAALGLGSLAAARDDLVEEGPPAAASVPLPSRPCRGGRAPASRRDRPAAVAWRDGSRDDARESIASPSLGLRDDARDDAGDGVFV